MPGASDHGALRRRQETIERALRAELEAAQIELESVKKQYRETAALIEDIGPNSPDGRQTLAALVKEQRSALDRYTVALREFNAFVLRGTIPERLRDSN